MIGSTDPRQQVANNDDERDRSDCRAADRTEPRALDGIDVADLRKIAPDALQLLASTGC